MLKGREGKILNIQSRAIPGKEPWQQARVLDQMNHRKAISSTHRELLSDTGNVYKDQINKLLRYKWVVWAGSTKDYSLHW